jgi:hypothetical protein
VPDGVIVDTGGELANTFIALEVPLHPVVELDIRTV